MKKVSVILFFFLNYAGSSAQDTSGPMVVGVSPEAVKAAKPWVFWYWMQASVSKEGIRADLEAMKEAGLGGAYLMPIKGAANPPLFAPIVEQLSPAWWDMLRYSLQEAKRLGLQIGMHVSDGFALAGGPWITPELSMQKVVSSRVIVSGGKTISITLPQPDTKEGYYKDIAVYAYPANEGENFTTETVLPKITTSVKDKMQEASVLAAPVKVAGTDKPAIGAFKSNQPCWIMYQFEKPFTCRSIRISTGGNSYQAHRLLLEVSDDGIKFRSIGRLKPPRHGWQDADADVTHTIAPVTARYYRFTYDPAGSEPGAEDLDAAKWKPSLKLTGLILSSEPKINQYESKNGEVWRISESTNDTQLGASSCVPFAKIVDLSNNLSASGILNWKAPAGKWTIIRMGHTSTGHTNATGGAAAGLEVDKFNAKAIKLQFDSWYGEAIRQAGPELAEKILRVFHVDSWECGSQNWSDVFPAEFKKRRGYDLLPWLPVMAGVPLESAEKSEAVLYDVRRTIADLVSDTFYQTLAEIARKKGLTFSAESVAPTMMSDGLLHYKNVDVPMGEFWLNSPTHDKPNDMLDAVSGGHIYRKNIVQAEAFTTVRMAWNEHPGMLKTLQDRNYALGINRLVYHVFTHNPWTDRKPGMTLDGVGLYFQRDQTWWKPGKAWVEYATRTQELLQRGNPVTDIAVFTGEEYPRRAVLPERLVFSLPGIVGDKVVLKEKHRLENIAEPIAESPVGVMHSANITDPKDWADPLQGYAYDSFNPEVLMGATVKNGRVEFPSGASYAILVFPAGNPMDPSGGKLSPAVREKVSLLEKAGAHVIVAAESGPFKDTSFEKMGVERDLSVQDLEGREVLNMAWNHRASNTEDIYFISNQEDKVRILNFSFRIAGKIPYLYNAVNGNLKEINAFSVSGKRTLIPLKLDPNGAVFVIFKPIPDHRTSLLSPQKNNRNWSEFISFQQVSLEWKVKFDLSLGGPEKEVEFKELKDWSKHTDSLMRYYSGTAVYRKTIRLNEIPAAKLWLDLGKVANLATVKINGTVAGTVWTAPFSLDISKWIRKGDNLIEIEVTNTWANRLIGDHRLPEEKRITKTTAPYRLTASPLQEAGLLGPVKLMIEK